MTGREGLLWFDSLDSTNAEARRRAEAGETGPVWIAAREQTAGRGRRGRAWSTGQGNLAATFLTTTAKTPAEAAMVSFVAALAVHQLAKDIVGEASIKWPNDIQVSGRKAAGILVESGARPGGLWLAVGVGLNLASAPDDVERPAVALSRGGVAPTPEDALNRLASAFDRWWGVWDKHGLDAIVCGWKARAAGVPGPAQVRLPHETLDGHAEGLDSDGALRLRLADGSIRRITAGDVFFGNG